MDTTVTQATQPCDGFTDQSLATPLTKALRVLQALGGEGNRYFFDDGYPRTAVLRQDARAALRVLEEYSQAQAAQPPSPSTIDMILFCPECGAQHVDKPDPGRGWTNPPHRTHLCLSCGHLWRPAAVATQGVTKLPGHPEASESVHPAEVSRLHYFAFTFLGHRDEETPGASNSTLCTATVILGFINKLVTTARIQEAKHGVGVSKSSVLVGLFYLGFMSKEEVLDSDQPAVEGFGGV